VRQRTFTTHNARIIGAGALAIGAIIALGACNRTVFRPDDDRTPFDRYNRSRAQQPAPFLEDEYGRRTPNLRGRLIRSSE